MSANARAWWAVVGWGALVLTMTSIPLPAGEGPPGFPVDKLAHLAMYAGLGALVGRAAAADGRPSRRLVIALVGAAVFAGLDEWHQGWVGRDPSMADWAADVAGLLLGVAAWRWTARESTGNERDETRRESA